MTGYNEVDRNKRTYKDSGKVKKLLWAFVCVLSILAIVDFFVHRHAHLPWEGIPEFFPALGFFSCVLVVVVGKVMRLILKREEHYYE